MRLEFMSEVAILGAYTLGPGTGIIACGPIQADDGEGAKAVVLRALSVGNAAPVQEEDRIAKYVVHTMCMRADGRIFFVGGQYFEIREGCDSSDQEMFRRALTAFLWRTFTVLGISHPLAETVQELCHGAMASGTAPADRVLVHRADYLALLDECNRLTGSAMRACENET